MHSAVRLLDAGMLELRAQGAEHGLLIFLPQHLLFGFFGLGKALGRAAFACQRVDAFYLFLCHRRFLSVQRYDYTSFFAVCKEPCYNEKHEAPYRGKKENFSMAKTLNYAQQLDALLESLGETRPRLLLHACCGPCSSAVLEKLCRCFDITVLYYNPNTWPEAEYRRRGEELARFVAQAHPEGVKVVEEEYVPADFYAAVKGLENEPERGGRCTVCYRLRMERAAQYAAAHGFDYFTTTLSISPHKDAARINAIGEALAAQYGVKLLYADFKKQNGYLRSLQLSEEYGLYRQDYCGCEFSAKARSLAEKA